MIQDRQKPRARPLRDAAALAAVGLVPEAAVPALAEVAARYAVSVTPEMAALIDPSRADDPMARQFIPDPRELATLPEELPDPIGDAAHSPVPGVVHRYPDRALLKVVHACPVYCRFCFRREMVGPGGEALAGAALDEALAYLAATPAIWEVILTGGDPFMLSERRAALIMERLAEIPHIEVVRWHTRVPMVDPGRVTPGFVAALKRFPRAVFVAVHANHPREFTAEARAALARLADAGIALVSQSVLLRGVNADVPTLAALMRAFVAARVTPYYLHHPDLAPGTGHFRLSIEEGQALVEALRGHLSGLAQPTYVLDLPGGRGKVPIGPAFLRRGADGGWQARDRDGRWHAYRDSTP